MMEERTWPTEAWRRAARPVLLTFDDGPDPDVTPRVLETLDRHEVRAFFFLVGRRISCAPGQALARAICARGHGLGGHGFTHRDLTTLPDDVLLDEIREPERCLPEHGGPRLLRPPFGRWDLRVLRAARNTGTSGLLWNVDPRDWRARSDEWVSDVIDQVARLPFAIVLLHDVHAATAAHLDQCIRRLKEDLGATFPPLVDGDARPCPAGPGWAPAPGGGTIWQRLWYVPDTLGLKNASAEAREA
jgi:peptidoglycan/xylan/chitin deacetylase (PgdA/CDA1 family)